MMEHFEADMTVLEEGHLLLNTAYSKLEVANRMQLGVLLAVAIQFSALVLRWYWLWGLAILTAFAFIIWWHMVLRDVRKTLKRHRALLTYFKL